MSTERVSVNFDANTSGLQTGVNRAKGMLGGLGSFAKGIGGKIGAFIAGGMAVSYVSSVIEKFDRVGDLAKRFDTSTDAVQRLGFVAEQSGADLESLVSGLQKATIAGQNAANGSTAAISAFDALGISVTAFNAATPEEKIAMLADGFANSKNEGQALASIIKIMGKSAGELIPLLRDGGEAMRETMGEANIATAEAIANIQRLDDLWMRIKGNIAAAAAEVLNFATNAGGLLTDGKELDMSPKTLAEARYREMMEQRRRWDNYKNDGTPEDTIVKQYMEAVDQRGKIANATTPIIAASLTQIGGGGKVFGGNQNPQIRKLDAIIKELKDAYPKLEEIAKNTSEGALMP